MTSAEFSYSGKDNLEAMRLASRYNAFLFQLVQTNAEHAETVLDFGAGLGLFADMFRESGKKIQCLEPDGGLCERLTMRGYRTARSPETVDDESLDYVYSLNVLEHIDHDVLALRALVPKMRPGGHILVYVPAFPALFTSMDRQVGHQRRYTATTLRNALEAAGMEVIRTEYVDCLGFPATLFYRMAGGNGLLRSSSVAFYDRYVFPVSRLLDRVTHRWFGKNVFALARKPGRAEEPSTDSSGSRTPRS